jgi:predicted phage terminase large subunit-like protein
VTTLDWAEAAARLFEQPTRRWDGPLDLAHHLDPKTRRTPMLELLNSELVQLLDTTDGRLTASVAPQEGKTQLASKTFPLWALIQNPELRIAIVSYEHNVARRISRAIRDQITIHGADLGLAIRQDVSAQNEWQLAGHGGGVYSTGIGGALTGRPVDLMVIDDPVKDREQADSETYRERAWDWWLEVGATRLAPGAPVAVIATRWHESDLIGRLLSAEDGGTWRVVNVPAQADHDPAKGQTDPLDRQPGEFMVSARGRSPEQWESIKTRSGSRTWNALYQGRPAPAEGALFKRDAWSRYTEPLAIERGDGSMWVPVSPGDQLAASWDLAFKGADSSDYVVGQVWLRRGVHLYLLDMVRRRMTFTETLAEVKRLAVRWPQAVLKLVEDKANGPAVIDMLSRSVPGLIPVEPEGGKIARANSATPFVEAGNVHLPTAALLPNVEELVEEAAAFPTGAHDDAVDAMTQAINRLLLNPLLLEDDTADPDWDDVDDEMVISRY